MIIVTIKNYQEIAMTFAEYPRKDGKMYTMLGLTGEAGEFANKTKKVYRDDQSILAQVRRDQLIDEAGDGLWYVAASCTEMGLNLTDYLPMLIYPAFVWSDRSPETVAYHAIRANYFAASMAYELHEHSGRLTEDYRLFLRLYMGELGRLLITLGLKDFGQLAATNIAKLEENKKRGQIKGDELTRLRQRLADAEDEIARLKAIISDSAEAVGSMYSNG